MVQTTGSGLRSKGIALLIYFFSALSVLSAVNPSLADDWPQWRGPNRDGVSLEKGLLKQWPKGGPPLVWKIDTLGLGYSGPAIVGDRIYILGTQDKDEVLFVLDAKDGKVQWSTKIGSLFNLSGAFGSGPRATPSVDGDLVYVLGGFGDLVCVDVAKKAEVWRKNMVKDLQGTVSKVGSAPGGPAGWGYSWSPLVDGEQLICVPGGKQGLLAALNKKTGEVIWRSKEVTEDSTYSSPVALEIGGVRQYVQLTQAGVVGVDAKSGKLLWFNKLAKPYDDVVIPTPIIHKNSVFTTVGMSRKPNSQLLQVSKGASGFEAKQAWSNEVLINTQGGVVLLDGHLYGYSDDKSSFGLVCQQLANGQAAWNYEDLGVSSVTAADGHLYLLDHQEGIVVLAEANPKAWKEKGRFTLPEMSKKLATRGGIWTHPVIANGKLYLRNQELLFCYELKP